MLPILVGRWGEADSDAASEGLSGVGATHVAFTLADARDQIAAKGASAVPVTAPTAMTAAAEGLEPDRDPRDSPPFLRPGTSGADRWTVSHS